MSSPSRSGVFAKATDCRVNEFTESVSFDHRLYAHDITASQAHARMLRDVSLLTADECQQICQTLDSIGEEIAAGSFPLRSELEDIHMHIEQALIDRLGDVGRKLHTGRSRNDQVNTDFRLWIRDALDEVGSWLSKLQQAFLGRCSEDQGVILPGYTHLRRAQPVLASHYWLAYCEKFQRDRERLLDSRKRVNVCGLGAAALAGTSLPINRDQVAQELGFDSVASNSLDVSSDRDFVVETAFALTLIAEHLSTWADEWILWSSQEFNFLELPQDFCTGSSIMPQKINPDVLELIRGKTARVIGNLQGLLVLIKGLPLAYNRDLQEDKPALFDSFDTVLASLELAVPLVEQSKLKQEAIRSQLHLGHLDATNLMEYLIRQDLPQRTAHHVTGQLVRIALDEGVTLSELSLEKMQSCHEQIDDSIYGVLGVENAIRAFQSYGSTAPEQVQAQVEQWKQRLDER